MKRRQVIDLGLHLLDRQILDVDEREVANVDDIEFSDDDRPVITALLCGPGAYGPRLGGRLGSWVVAAHARLADCDRPGPVRIPWAHVRKVDSAVQLNVDGESTGALTLDHWARDHFVARIPGANVAGE
jgi:sporulation protein YlmC with PRC-barrel domain